MMGVDDLQAVIMVVVVTEMTRIIVTLSREVIECNMEIYCVLSGLELGTFMD